MTRLVMITCAHCATPALKEANAVNRASRAGLKVYCSRECSGLGRRRPDGVTPEMLKAAKSEYDRQRRHDLRARIKLEKAAYFKRTYDPTKAAVERKANMPRHVEYCRRPEYVAWKREYDRRYLAEKQFGSFAESFLLLRDLETEVLSRASRYEISLTNGTLNKRNKRRNGYGQTVSG